MPDEPRVQYQTLNNGMIAVVALNRPRYRNALSDQTMDEVSAAFRRAVEDEHVRVIILRGEGPHFSAGADLGSPDVQQNPPHDSLSVPQRYDQMWQTEMEHFLRLRAIPKPTIAQVQGFCIYDAFALVSTMDVVFAADNAQFLSTDLEYFSTPLDLGARKTKELLYENRILGADEAREFGLVQRVYPVGELEAKTIEYAERVCEQDPFRMRILKMSINQMQDIQGYTPYIMSHHTAFMVSRSASPSIDGTAPGGTRGRHSTLDNAKSHTDYADGGNFR